MVRAEEETRENESCSANLCVIAVDMWPSHRQMMGTVIALAQQLEPLREAIKHPRCLEDLLESRKGCLPRLSHSLADPAPETSFREGCWSSVTADYVQARTHALAACPDCALLQV